MKKLNLKEEKKLWKKGYKWVACLDEAGRGCLAGPVVAAAVMIKNPKFKTLNPKQIQNLKFKYSRGVGFQILNLKIKDSKKLSPKIREIFYQIFTTHPQIEWGIGKTSEKMIDRINIQNATELAMLRAVQKLKKKPDFLIIDGNRLNSKKLKAINYKLIVKADEKVFSCSLSSIIAKVIRDRIMRRYHKKYPKYGFDRHKGYLTKYHRKMLKKYGPCKIHRKTFYPLTP